MYNISDKMLWDVAAELFDTEGLNLTERQVLRIFGSHYFIDSDYVDVWIDNLASKDKVVILNRIRLVFQDYVLEKLHNVWHNIIDEVRGY